jgi:redox-sensitive bicupin YhaK (pirin superfamily)
MSKIVLGIYGNNRVQWVGNGFPVRTLFSYTSLNQHVSPFLMLDYFGPHHFEPTSEHRGSDQHPHRGFEIVTIVYEGQFEHHDSAGNGGIIGAGDVQWMTAGRGVLHQELHGPMLKKAGGVLRAIQLGVNLPASDKMAPSGYQALSAAQIPVLDLPLGAGKARVIAGQFRGKTGPARTFTPISMTDLRLTRGADFRLELPSGHTTMLIVVAGMVLLSGDENVSEAEMALLTREAKAIRIQVDADATVLVLSGEPIEEPIVGKGPFVMNNDAQIQQAFEDLKSGRFPDAI